MSKPSFPGDRHSALRDAQAATRNETLRMLVGSIYRSYLNAAAIAGRTEDPIADHLRFEPFFDVRTVQVAHDYLAAYWRWSRQHWSPRIGWTTQGLIVEWRGWLRYEAQWWLREQPLLVRRFCLVLANQNTPEGIVAEMDLWDELRAAYPVPLNSSAASPAGTPPPR